MPISDTVSVLWVEEMSEFGELKEAMVVSDNCESIVLPSAEGPVVVSNNLKDTSGVWAVAISGICVEIILSSIICARVEEPSGLSEGIEGLVVVSSNIRELSGICVDIMAAGMVCESVEVISEDCVTSG